MKGLRSRVVRIIQEKGVASPKQVAEALGADFQGGRKLMLLYQTLGRMVKANILCRGERGRYRVAARGAARALTVNEDTERRIVAFLESVGGVARTKDIHSALWGRPVDGKDRPADYRDITHALKHSHLLRQDFGRGFWNLDAERRERLPLPGYWAAQMLEDDYAGKPADDWMQACEIHFEDVGTAFAEGRGDMALEAIADHPTIRDHLQAMSQKSPGARARALDSLKTTIADLLGETATEYQLNKAVRERKSEISRELYAAFEMGARDLHTVASAAFYRDCAALFGVCPVKLSRGRAVKLAEG